MYTRYTRTWVESSSCLKLSGLFITRKCEIHIWFQHTKCTQLLHYIVAMASTQTIYTTHTAHTHSNGQCKRRNRKRKFNSASIDRSRNFCEFEKKNIVEIDVCKMNKIYTIPQYGKKNWPFVWVSKSINLPRSGVWLQLNIADNAQCDPIFMYVQIFLFSRSA